MKPDSSSPPTPGEVFYARTFALLTLALLGYLLFQILSPFLAPILWALFIAFLLYPFNAWMIGRLKGRSALSAAILTTVTLLVLLGPLTALGAAFAQQVAELLRFAQRFASEHGSSGLSDLTTMPVVGTLLAWLHEYLGISLAQIQSWAVESARTVLQSLASLGRTVFVGALGTVIGFVMMMFILFFAFRDGENLLTTLRTLIPMSTEHKARLFDHLAGVVRALVFGTGVTAITQGTLVAIGFALVGLPSPIVFGVLAALFALIPMAGTPVVWVPAALVLAVQQRWVAAIFMLIWGVGVTMVDNVLRPLLVSGRAQIGALTVFIGVLGGVSTFGPLGVFLGPLVLALVIALIRFAVEVRQEDTVEPSP